MIIKKFNKFNENNSEFNLEKAISLIKEEYPEEVVVARFDDEVLEWVDENWEEDYESEYDWYIDHNNGEAQDVVIGELIDWYTTEHGEIDFDISDFSDTLREEYGI